MDNGVGILNVELGKKKGGDDWVNGEGVKERVVVEAEELEGDEVFEEAVDTPLHLQEGVTDEVGYGRSEGDVFVEIIRDSSLIAVDENSKVGNEVEKFEEAFGNLDEAENHKEMVDAVLVDDEKVEKLGGGESVDVAVGNGFLVEGTDKEASIGYLGNDGLVGVGENDGKAVGEIDASDGLKVLNTENEMSEMCSSIIEKLETGDSDMTMLEERLPDGKTEGGGTVEVLEGVLDTCQDVQYESKDVEEIKLGTEYQDEIPGEPNINSVGLQLETHFEQVEDLKENVATLVAERQVDESRELENNAADVTSEHMNDVGEVPRDSLVEVNAGNLNGWNEEVHDSSAVLVGEHQNDYCASVEEGIVLPEIAKSCSCSVVEKNDDFQTGTTISRDILLERNTEHHEGENGKVNDSSAVLGSEQHNETYIQENTTNDLPVSVEVTTVVSETESLSSSASSVEVTNVVSDTGSSSSSASSVEVTTEMPKIGSSSASVSSVEVTKSDTGSSSSSTNSVEVTTLMSKTGSPSSAVSSVIERNEEMHAGTTNLRVVDRPVCTDQKSQEENKIAQTEKEQKIHLPPQHASPSEKSSNPAIDPTPACPAGLGRAAPLLEPAPRIVQQPRVNGSVSHMQHQHNEESTNGETEEYDETREKLQMIRVKFLRLARRLGQTPHNVVVAQVLYRLGLAEQLRGRNGGRVGAFSFDRASAMAEQLEAAGQEPLDFSCTIMVLGKTGVGKSATINSIFDEQKFSTDAFQMGTMKVQDVVGTVQGIKVRVIDTPGLLPSWSDQRHNEKVLHTVKRFNKKTPPDIVLYLDRLDMQSRDLGDMPLLRTITEVFGPSIWFNAIVVLTHAASAPPDGPNGTASSYEMFVNQRTHGVQQAIRQAAEDMRLMNPVSLVENHSACRTNRAGQRVLPNGQVWKPHLLLLSFASKILAEANELLKLQNSPPGKPFATPSRAPPLPYLLTSLLQSRQQVKLPEEQLEDEDGLDDVLDESSDSEDESEYDELPPFKRLTKAQVAMLTKSQKKAYFDELEYRDNLLMKKQLKEEQKRRKMMKKMAASLNDMPSEYSEEVEESGGSASLPVPMPDLALPASFDSDNPTHRYRFLDSTNQWLVRPVLDTHGWDHDVGYEGLNVEKLFVVKGKVPVSFSSQVTKDKKDSNIQMEIASSLKHGEGRATSLGFDMQTVGKDMAYTLRSETRFSNYAKNKATAGISLTQLGDALSAGVKLEDKLIVNKRFLMVVTGGAMSGRGDVAYGGSLEAQLRDKDYPLGRSLSTLGLSIMDWHGDLAIGCNLQSQIPIGRHSNLIARANMNNRGAGQISIRINSSEQLQIALIGLIPFLTKVLSHYPFLQFGQ